MPVAKKEHHREKIATLPTTQPEKSFHCHRHGDIELVVNLGSADTWCGLCAAEVFDRLGIYRATGK